MKKDTCSRCEYWEHRSNIQEERKAIYKVLLILSLAANIAWWLT